ncbi:hypothetical protein A0H81_03451 [Grifola frondosa]|uniref:Uncharacterized protein n=1 Tax=Grifola frondosa TaxID=5627 RepID=A0A1C7MIU3_GRIFR|nr:hypothetical protein A0H81_03451 [Grifola frondosa]
MWQDRMTTARTTRASRSAKPPTHEELTKDHGSTITNVDDGRDATDFLIGEGPGPTRNLRRVVLDVGRGLSVD